MPLLWFDKSATFVLVGLDSLSVCAHGRCDKGGAGQLVASVGGSRVTYTGVTLGKVQATATAPHSVEERRAHVFTTVPGGFSFSQAFTIFSLKPHVS